MFSRGEIPLLLRKAGITNLSNEQIPKDGLFFGDCICFSVSIKSLPSNSQKQNYQSWEELSKQLEARRETTQFVYDSLCTFTRAFNIKFDKFFANKETEDVPLHVLEFDGKEIFTLAMRTKNKPLMTEAIGFWRDMMVWLEETLATSNISIRSSIYSGNICVGFFPDHQRKMINLFYFGSAFNGAKRGVKLSFELHLEQSIALDSEFALSFPRKTNMLAYALKQIDISNIKIGDSKIISSFSVLRHDSIEKSGNSQFFLKSFEFNAKTFSDSPLREGMSLEQHLKTLDFHKEGFEMAGQIKITFSLPLLLGQNQIQGQPASLGYLGRQAPLVPEVNLKPSKDHPRGKDTDWSALRNNLKDYLKRIVQKLNPLLNNLGAELDGVNYCGFNGLLDLNVMIRGALDISVRTALLAGSIRSLTFVDKLIGIKATSSVFLFFVMMGTGNQVHFFKEQDLEYVKQEGGVQELRLSIDAANQYSRAFPIDSNTIQPEQTPIQCSPARIFTDKRKTIITQLTQAFRTGVPSTLTYVEGEKGTGKTCFLQLLQNDISAYFQNQCLILTKSLRSSFFKEIFQKCKEETANRKQFNGFRSILKTESKDFYQRIGFQNKQQRSLSMNVTNLQGFDTFKLLNQQEKDFELNQRPISFQETISQSQDNLIDIALVLLKQHLIRAGRRLIVFIFDEMEYLDCESWEIVKFLCEKGIGQGITVAIIGAFRYHLPGELKTDMQNQQNQRIRTSEQLFQNNELLKDRIMACENDRTNRINLNSLSNSDAELLLFTFAVNAFNARINKFESAATFQTLLSLAKQNQANTPLKLVYFFHQMCKQEYILGYYEQILTTSNTSQQQKQSENKEIKNKTNQLKKSEIVSNKSAEKYYEKDYDMNDIIIDSEVIPKNTFPMNINSSLKSATMAEEGVILCLSRSFKSRGSSDFQSCLDVPIAIMNHSQVILYFLLHEDNERYYSIPNEKYPGFQTSTILMPNWSILLTKAISLNGSFPQVSKLNYALSRSLNILPEQINDTLLDLTYFRFIRVVNSSSLNSKENIKKTKAKRSLLGYDETNSQNKEDFQINWNESLFFQVRQSLQQSASRRMRLLLHRCFYESMESLLVKLGKKAERSLEYASIFMEMLHHNSKFQLLKSSQLLKKISPQITFLFRKGVFYQGIARKVSSQEEALTECDVRLSYQNVCIFKKNEKMSDKSQTQEHKNLWIINRDYFSFEEDQGNSSIELTCTQITKKPKIENAKIVKKLKLIKLLFQSKIEYYTFFLGLKYLQIPQTLQKQNQLRIKVTWSSQLPNFIDPMGKTEMLKNKQTESLFILKSDIEFIRKRQEVQEQIDNILEFIPYAILDLMKNYKSKRSSPSQKRNINPQVSNPGISEESQRQSKDDLKNIEINTKPQQLDKNLGSNNSNFKFITPQKKKRLLNNISTAKSEYEETEEPPLDTFIQQRKIETGIQGETQQETGKFNELDQKLLKDPQVIEQKILNSIQDNTQTFRVQQESTYEDSSNLPPLSNSRQFQKGDLLMSIEEEDQNVQNSYFNQTIPQEVLLDDNTPPLLAQREDINKVNSNKKSNLNGFSSPKNIPRNQMDDISTSQINKKEAKDIEITPQSPSNFQDGTLFTFSNEEQQSPPQDEQSQQSLPKESNTPYLNNNSTDSQIPKQQNQSQNLQNIQNKKGKQNILPNQIVSKELQMRLAHLQFEQNNSTPSQSVLESAQSNSYQNHPNLPIYQDKILNLPQTSSTNSLNSSSFNYSHLNRLGSYNQTTSSSVAHLSKVKITSQEAQKRQQDLFLKKKESLRKMSNLSHSPSGPSGMPNYVNSPDASEHTFPQCEDQNLQLNQDNGFRQCSQGIIDSRNYSLKQSDFNHSIKRIVMEDCSSIKGDIFEVKRNDCMKVEFLEDGNTLCYFNDKVGSIPRKFIKILQQSHN